MRTYADEGKSGLSIDGRASLQRLIADVESGNTDFNLILVYDVSRWGRFQDADESAYYEYICKRKNIHVAYVAEQFENDGSPVSTIVKGVNRCINLLEGICPEAIELLQDKQFTPDVTRILRNMKAARQVEAVELMIASNTITVAHAEALLKATHHPNSVQAT